MYTVPAKEVVYEQSESALIEQGRFLLSDESLRSQGSEETLSPNQDGTFSYGAVSEPLGSDIEPLMERQSAKFFQNLERADIADTARQAYAGVGARPRTRKDPRHVASRPPSDTAGPTKPAHTEYRDFFNIEPDTPVFKCHASPSH